MTETSRSLTTLRADLKNFYQAAVNAADPGAALERALVGAVPPKSVHVLAVGKAAEAMAATAVHWLDRHGLEPVSGLIVGPVDIPAPHKRMRVVSGNHPQPGGDSLAAAQAVESFTSSIEPGDTGWLLLSGGASSLMAGPVPGVSSEDLVSLFGLLGMAGLDIHALNAVRKRFLQWGAGRLSQTIGPTPWQTFAISDVPGDVPASIGSGPTCPDQHTIADVITILERSGFDDSLPRTIEANIAGIASGEISETPKQNDPVFTGERFAIISSNTAACQGAAAAAEERGWTVTIGEPITGEAAENGRSIGSTLAADGTATRRCLILGGETVVRIGPHHGRGGRCQELALAAAQKLSESPEKIMALLAAGTDGRDGPTDAAGAIVDPGTWGTIAAAGRDPASDLAGHASYDALRVADALFTPGPSGTNVMDIVIGLG